MVRSFTDAVLAQLKEKATFNKSFRINCIEKPTISKVRSLVLTLKSKFEKPRNKRAPKAQRNKDEKDSKRQKAWGWGRFAPLYSFV